jgi:hypothetical protein
MLMWMIAGCCENAIPRKAAEDASTTANCSNFGRPCQDLSAGLLIKLNLALNCSAALPGLPASGDEATATTNNLQGLFPLHTRRTLLLQWLLHMKVSPYDGYLSKGKQALTPIRYKAKGV